MTTITDAIADFIQYRTAQHYSPHTIRNYQNTFRAFIAWLDCNPEPGQIGASHMIKFLGSREGLSKKTVLNYHADLSSLWGWMVGQGLAAANVMRQVPAPRPGVRAIAALSRLEVSALIQAAFEGQRPARDRAIVLLLLDTGMRASELCSLAVGDISWIARRLRVVGKGDKERYLIFSATTSQVLEDYLQGRKSGLVFDLNRLSLLLLFRRLGQRAGVIHCHPHRLRHTFAIQFLRNRGNVYSLQAALGHSSLDMVKRYLEISQADLESDMDRASPVEGWGL